MLALGVLVSKPLAWVFFGIAVAALFLISAGHEWAQRHIPDLGRLPLVHDYCFHSKAQRATNAMVESPQHRLRPPLRYEASGMATARERTVVRNAEKRLGQEAQERKARQEAVARSEAKRSIERGNDLVMRITNAQLHFAIASVGPVAAISLGDLTAQVEVWVSSSGGGYLIPQPGTDKPTSADWSRLRLYVERHIEALGMRSGLSATDGASGT